MTTIPHVIAGAAIGALSPSPVVAITGGFFSHFVLDFIPHWDSLFNKLPRTESPQQQKTLPRYSTKLSAEDCNHFSIHPPARGGGFSASDYKRYSNRFKKGKLLFYFLLAVDLGVSVAILILVLPYPNMFIGAIAGALPDLDNLLQYKFKQFPLLSRIGITIHDGNNYWHRNTTFLKAVFTQGIVTIVGLTILYLKIS